MISARMMRPAKLVLAVSAVAAAAGALAACGTESISVPKSQTTLYQGAVLFQQRCAGCHTLSYAATHGSAANVRTSQYNNGPNFDQRCERPAIRVLYAIENGGFSGAIMPQNVVVGQQAREVAMFVATYSGRKAPKVPGVVPCNSKQNPVGTLPSVSGAGVAAATSQAKKTSAAQKKASGKVRASRPKGGGKGKKPSTGTGQGQGPGG